MPREVVHRVAELERQARKTYGPETPYSRGDGRLQRRLGRPGRWSKTGVPGVDFIALSGGPFDGEILKTEDSSIRLKFNGGRALYEREFNEVTEKFVFRFKLVTL